MNSNLPGAIFVQGVKVEDRNLLPAKVINYAHKESSIRAFGERHFFFQKCVFARQIYSCTADKYSPATDDYRLYWMIHFKNPQQMIIVQLRRYSFIVLAK
jgi:hypothetical protein